jgi:S1-C subfamily serine protease
MRLHSLVTPALVLSAFATAAAQPTRIYSAPSVGAIRVGDDQPRAALGLTMSGSTSLRDTLGLLVASVTARGPAERAGVEEGDRIASINGVSLRLSPDDAGDNDGNGAMTRRLMKELGRVHPGDDVDLRIYSGRRVRTVRVQTADADSLFGRRRVARTDTDDRATLGFGLGSTGSRRDSLGILVMFVDDSGPAGRAGLEEGNRIAEINGVDLRAGRDDSNDDFIGNARIRRLQREISRLHPGDDVDLRIYANGRYRDVRVRAARASDLSRRRNAFIIGGDGMGVMPPGLMPMNFDGAMVGSEVRRSIERAMEGAGRALEGVGRGLGRSRSLQLDNDDRAPRAERRVPLKIEPMEPLEPLRVEPMEPTRLRRMTPSKVPYATTLTRERATRDEMSAAAMRDAANNSASIDIGGLRMVPVGAELSEYLGKGSDRGLLVIEVPRWARSAMRAGDVVLSIDGNRVRPDDGSDAVSVSLPRNRDAQLEIIRDSARQSVTLPPRR